MPFRLSTLVFAAVAGIAIYGLLYLLLTRVLAVLPLNAAAIVAIAIMLSYPLALMARARRRSTRHDRVIRPNGR